MFPSKTRTPAAVALAAASLVVAVCVTAAVMATTASYNHDEEQYIAAAVLAAGHALYRDFIYFQTPLYPLLLSRLPWSAPGEVYALARWVSGALFVLCCLLAAAVCARACGSRRAAAAAALLLCTTPVVQVAAGSARNDILPCFFLFAGLLAATVDLARPPDAPPAPPRTGAWSWFLCGLCLALAVAAKVSYAFAPAAAFVYLVWPRPAGAARPTGPVLAYCAGCAAGALPMAYHLAASPENFVYSVVGFHLTAPIDWYTRNHFAGRLSATYRFVYALKTLGKNPPALAALVLAAWSATCLVRARGWRAVPATWGRGPRGLIAFMLVASVPFGLLPNPPHPQYMLPVFALLVPFGACCLPDLHPPTGAAGSRRRRVLLGLVVCLGAGLGAGRVAARLPRFVHPPSWTTERVRQESLAIRAALPAGSPGCVATLSPIRVLGAGAAIYPELASGPFFFRSGDLLPPDRVRALRGVSPSTLARMLDETPPSAVFVGYESGGRWRVNLDAELVAHAVSRGWPEVRLGAGDGRGRLFLNPGPSVPCG